MTDRTVIPLTAEFDLMVAPYPNGVRLSLLPDREAPAHVSVSVNTGALLTAIDAADPDAMRAYLRETAPDFVADTLRPEELDAIPEADSPDDVDERTDILDDDNDLITTPIGRLLLVQRIAHLYPNDAPSEHRVVANWIIDGEQR